MEQAVIRLSGSPISVYTERGRVDIEKVGGRGWVEAVGRPGLKVRGLAFRDDFRGRLVSRAHALDPGFMVRWGSKFSSFVQAFVSRVRMQPGSEQSVRKADQRADRIAQQRG
eukprot:7680770-Pyramimonas_sp.AAC.1